MNERDSHFDLDWLAFQYVTDALPVDEREDFERRLLDSQEAREAVARAVELTLAADFVCRERREVEPARRATPPAARNRGRRNGSRLVWAAVAASVAFAIGWQAAVWFFDDQLASISSGPGAPVASNGDARESNSGRDLALAWSQSRELSAAEELDRELLNMGEANENDEPGDLEENATTDAVEAPSWMLAAVAGLQGALVDQPPEAENGTANPAPPLPPANSNEG